MKSQHRFFLRRAAGVVLLGVSFAVASHARAESKAVGNPPVIDEQPIGRIVSEGGHVTLSVVAHGTAPLFYEWLKNGQPLPTAPPITGNATAVLNIDPVVTNDTGGYSVIITNGSGSITSSPVSVLANKIGTQLTAQGGTGLLMRLFGPVGDVYRIESANTLGGPTTTNGYATNRTGTAQIFLPFAGLGNFIFVRFDHMLPILYPTGVGTLRAYGKLSQAWRFDASGDLKTWLPLATITNSTGWVTFGDPRDFIPLQQFYRIAPP